MHLQESGEMYLETILVLSKTGKYVRSVDVSEYMGFSKPSVSRAIGLLKTGGYVTMDKSGHLELTDAGRAVAENIYEKHTMLTRFLVSLGVDENTAAEDACKIRRHGVISSLSPPVPEHKKAGRPRGSPHRLSSFFSCYVVLLLGLLNLSNRIVLSFHSLLQRIVGHIRRERNNSGPLLVADLSLGHVL